MERIFNIFKIEYYWYEGEHEINYLGKKNTQEEFEKDLIKAKEFAQGLIGKKFKIGLDKDYLGKGYRIECLPEFYKQIIWFLVKKLGYIICDIDEDISYYISDYPNGKKIIITRSEKQFKDYKLK